MKVYYYNPSLKVNVNLRHWVSGSFTLIFSLIFFTLKFCLVIRCRGSALISDLVSVGCEKEATALNTRVNLRLAETRSEIKAEPLNLTIFCETLIRLR